MYRLFRWSILGSGTTGKSPYIVFYGMSISIFGVFFA